MLAYDFPVLQLHRNELQAHLKEAKAKNEDEKLKILEVVEKIGQTERTIEDLLAHKEKAIEVLSTIPIH